MVQTLVYIQRLEFVSWFSLRSPDEESFDAIDWEEDDLEASWLLLFITERRAERLGERKTPLDSREERNGFSCSDVTALPPQAWGPQTRSKVEQH